MRPQRLHISAESSIWRGSFCVFETKKRFQKANGSSKLRTLVIDIVKATDISPLIHIPFIVKIQNLTIIAEFILLN